MSAASQIAALVFTSAFGLAAWTIVSMFAAYRHKMVAALLFEPIPRDAPIVLRKTAR
ncbi:hypothetical protein [Sphingobium sp. MI1205]|uniref:hypothetical protein n=1 Tax=Sphingobium sp. MI1205 TaxID=407020 RepID=UPI00076FF156|nr:hypothetical protein [Sphingobium sp. MI1205]AMK19359.1 hypothetical protein K663_14905 [Sphingobium sp. MI1205]